ncbi:unnamed protein product, partial [Rangifer tarandus platyrhynchus]
AHQRGLGRGTPAGGAVAWRRWRELTGAQRLRSGLQTAQRGDGRGQKVRAAPRDFPGVGVEDLGTTLTFNFPGQTTPRCLRRREPTLS